MPQRNPTINKPSLDIAVYRSRWVHDQGFTAPILPETGSTVQTFNELNQIQPP